LTDRKQITVKVLPGGDGAGTVRTYRIARWRITFGRIAPYLVGGLGALVIAHTVYSFGQHQNIRDLRDENIHLRGQIESVDAQVHALARVVDRVGRFDARLRQVTMLSDPERNLAMGPVGEKATKQVDTSGRATSALKRDLLGEGGADRAVDLIRDRVALLGDEAEIAESSVRSLQLHLEDQQSLLRATPSLNPTRGWRTSEFGWRTDPYTGLRQMHAGVDIATEHGRPVSAPGDGVVTFAGMQGAYGKVVIIDHGQGLTTVYAHLNEYHVKVGGEVERGAIIGEVGNTGRSTGPHLHYEVRLNGVPQDPDRFILE